jgi:hypothetical protein
MRPVDETMLDGNAAAGELAQVFSVDITSVQSTCANCGSTGALGAAHLFNGPGYVLRCTVCGCVLLRLVTAPGRIFIELTGIRLMEIPTV